MAATVDGAALPNFPFPLSVALRAPPLPHMRGGEEGRRDCGRHFLSPVERGRGGRAADGAGVEPQGAALPFMGKCMASGSGVVPSAEIRPSISARFAGTAFAGGEQGGDYQFPSGAADADAGGAAGHETQRQQPFGGDGV